MPIDTTFCTLAPRFLDQVHAHDQIVVEIAARILAVGTDTADDGGEMDDHIRAFRFQHFPYRGRLSQVVLRNAGSHDRGRVESLQSVAHVLSNKACTTGNQHCAVCENAHDRVSEEVRRMVTVVLGYRLIRGCRQEGTIASAGMSRFPVGRPKNLGCDQLAGSRCASVNSHVGDAGTPERITLRETRTNRIRARLARRHVSRKVHGFRASWSHPARKAQMRVSNCTRH